MTKKWEVQRRFRLMMVGIRAYIAGDPNAPNETLLQRTLLDFVESILEPAEGVANVKTFGEMAAQLNSFRHYGTPWGMNLFVVANSLGRQARLLPRLDEAILDGIAITLKPYRR